MAEISEEDDDVQMDGYFKCVGILLTGTLSFPEMNDHIFLLLCTYWTSLLLDLMTVQLFVKSSVMIMTV